MLSPDDLLNLTKTEPSAQTLAELTPQLLELLHESRAALRERSYAVLATWLEKGYYEETLKSLGDTFAHNLDLGLGKTDGDEAFVRAYSSLLLGEAIGYDAKNRKLSDTNCRRYLEASLNYMQSERDTRDFVSREKGWIHAIAHDADLLMQLANHPLLEIAELTSLLDTVAHVVRRLDGKVYLNLEDERLAYAAVNALKRELLSEEAVLAWLHDLTKPFAWGDDWREGLNEGQLEYARTYPWWSVYDAGSPYLEAYANIRNFVRSLYLQLSLASHELKLEPVEIALKQLDTGFYDLP